MSESGEPCKLPEAIFARLPNDGSDLRDVTSHPLRVVPTSREPSHAGGPPPRLCKEAVTERDPRFDGVFFVGITTH
jgi:hypothetical protein